MPGKFATLCAGVGTQLALVGLLSGVASQVDDEIGAVGEDFATEGAPLFLDIHLPSSCWFRQFTIIDHYELKRNCYILQKNSLQVHFRPPSFG